jgi:transcriptional regulator with XRE-family HTH domain
MADFLELTERTYRAYEAGDIDPPSSKTTKLAEYFGVTTDYLLGLKNFWTDAEGNIKTKVPADILNLDTEELKRKLEVDRG